MPSADDTPVPTGGDFDRGLLDTSVVIALADIEVDALPLEGAISALTLAELAAGVSSARDPIVRAARVHAIRAAEATFSVLPFEAETARIYGQVDTLVRLAGRKPRGRMVDLLIAATAIAYDLPLLTRNPKDLVGLESALRVVVI